MTWGSPKCEKIGVQWNFLLYSCSLADGKTKKMHFRADFNAKRHPFNARTAMNGGKGDVRSRHRREALYLREWRRGTD